MSAKPAPRYFGVVPAAGSGSRMQAEQPKQYLALGGVPVLQRTLQAMLDWGFLEQIVVATAAGDSHWGELAVSGEPRILQVTGGAERADSVLAGLRALQPRAAADDWVLVHDAARPCVSAASVLRLRDTLADDPVGGLLAQPVAETVKRADDRDRVSETLDRRGLWLAQTPQMFRFGALLEALVAALAAGEPVTDEAAAMERAGSQPRLVAGDPGNIKITRQQDLVFAEALLGGGG